MTTISDRRRPGPYRSRRAVLLGVCRGLADYFEISPFWVRLGAVALLFLTGIWPVVLLYVVAGMLMKKEPVIPFAGDLDQEFYESYQSSRRLALRRLQRTYQGLHRRIERLEHRVTARDFDWGRRLRES